MFSLAGHRIGDAWYYTEEDCVHVFFLVRNLSEGRGHDIGHAVSWDLVNWEYLGLVLERGPAGSWDDKNLATGSVIHRDGRYWMAYTGHKYEDFFVQLGSVGGDGQGDLLEQFPNLTSVLELSLPFHYQPGDCTVHHGYTVHGAPVNSTDKSRWSYLFSYSPSDTRYWNGSAANWGNERKRLSDPDNPKVHFPDFDEV